MQTTKRFDKAVSDLVQAYFDGTLEAENPCSCAVGTICHSSKWTEVFVTSHANLNYKIALEKYYNNEDARKVIDSTGYTPLELAKVEYTFECACSQYVVNTDPDDYLKKEQEFEGLCAVIDVLIEIDGLDKEIGEGVKSQLNEKITN